MYRKDVIPGNDDVQLQPLLSPSAPPASLHTNGDLGPSLPDHEYKETPSTRMMQSAGTSFDLPKIIQDQLFDPKIFENTNSDIVVYNTKNYEQFNGDCDYLGYPINTSFEETKEPGLVERAYIKYNQGTRNNIELNSIGLGNTNSQKFFLAKGNQRTYGFTSVSAHSLDPRQENDQYIKNGDIHIINVPAGDAYGIVVINGRGMLVPPGKRVILKGHNISWHKLVNISSLEIDLHDGRKIITIPSEKVMYLSTKEGAKTAMVGGICFIKEAHNTVLDYEVREDGKAKKKTTHSLKPKAIELKNIEADTADGRKVTFNIKFTYQIVNPQLALQVFGGPNNIHGTNGEENQPELRIRNALISIVKKYNQSDLESIHTLDEKPVSAEDNLRKTVPEIARQLKAEFTKAGILVDDLSIDTPRNEAAHRLREQQKTEAETQAVSADIQHKAAIRKIQEDTAIQKESEERARIINEAKQQTKVAEKVLESKLSADLAAAEIALEEARNQKAIADLNRRAALQQAQDANTMTAKIASAKQNDELAAQVAAADLRRTNEKNQAALATADTEGKKLVIAAENAAKVKEIEMQSALKTAQVQAQIKELELKTEAQKTPLGLLMLLPGVDLQMAMKFALEMERMKLVEHEKAKHPLPMTMHVTGDPNLNLAHSVAALLEGGNSTFVARRTLTSQTNAQATNQVSPDEFKASLS